MMFESSNSWESLMVKIFLTVGAKCLKDLFTYAVKNHR